MTYQGSEVSVSGGKPIELFKFVGTYASFYYTSGPEAITFLGNTYVPIAIKRSDVRTGTQEDDGLDLNIELPVSVQLVKTYAFTTAPPRLDLTVYRYHRGAPGDYVAYWQGPVNNIQVSGGRATLRSPSALANALVGAVPNVYYQTPCNHVLYDSRCKVVEALYTVNTTATVVNKRAITVASIGTLTGKLIGGELRNAAGERRMIVGQAGNVLTVNFPFATLAVGGAVSVVAGCDHAYEGDCKNRFNNQVNFGGFPFIPAENVFQEGMEPGKKIADNTCLPPMWNPVFEGWYTEWTIDYLASGVAPFDHEPGWNMESRFGTWMSYSTSPASLWVNGGHILYWDTVNCKIVVRERNPGAYAPQERRWRFQFKSGGVPAGCKATLTIRRWDEQFASALFPKATSTSISPGQTSWSLGSPWAYRGLWPDDWYFDY